MKIQLGLLAVAFSLSLIVIAPAYAGDVTSFSLDKAFYTKAEKFSFGGVVGSTYQGAVYVVIHDSNGNYKGMLSDPLAGDGTFSTMPRPVDDFFATSGTYNVTAFTKNEQQKNGKVIQIEFDGSKIFKTQEFVLELEPIQNREVDELKTVTFTVGIKDSSIEGIAYSLGGDVPDGATIDPDTGKFVWTPSGSHGNNPGAEYTFDIIATKGSKTDKDTITITVNDPIAVKPEPKKIEEPKVVPVEPREIAAEEAAEPEPPKLKVPAAFVEDGTDPQHYIDRYNNEEGYKKWFKDNYPQYDSIYHAVGLDEPLLIPAPFVDTTTDPQRYVDRYNNEEGYKKWFDETYPEYNSIYHAVGLDEPKKLAPFVNATQDPQHYIDRYNNEADYRKWFDENYPNMTIYEAVGLDEEWIVKAGFGECGEGTDLVDGHCTVIPPENGGGCLIATAAYGSEMAPQVQFLREIRDNQLMGTGSGASFMTGFNQVYYSFSPYIADMQRESPAFKEMVRVGITPMLTSLHLMEHAETESQVVGYGIGVILMNLGMYLAAPAAAVLGIRRLVRF